MKRCKARAYHPQKWRIKWKRKWKMTWKLLFRVQGLTCVCVCVFFWVRGGVEGYKISATVHIPPV